MTKEKLLKAIEINTKINKLEYNIENLKNNTTHKITSVNSKGNSCPIFMPQEVIDFAIAYFTNEKNKLEKELEEL